MMTSQEVRWCVEERDTGMPCASGSAPTEEEASREMMRYAMQYGQDGPVLYWMRQNRKTLVKGEIAGVSVTMMRTDGGDLRTLLAGH
jgi:hypothetical protein